VVYSTGPQSLWQRPSDKWRRGGLLHDFERVETGGDEAVLVDRPGRFLPLWRREGAWNAFVSERHAQHLSRDAAARDRSCIAYLWNPRFWPYVRLLEADYVVYHIHDAWTAEAWPNGLRRRHRKLVERADLIIATADNMSRDLPGIGPGGARILPHGVDFAVVEAGAMAPCPEDLATIPRPRIGYTGRVNLKLDFPLIAEAARRRADLHWIFIGATGIGTSYSFNARPEVKADWNLLNRLGNVHFLGVKDRREIPAYLHGCDVLSLPFSSSYVGFPTKLYEYLASGKPVVSWNGENVRPLTHLIALADGADEWLSAIDRALAGRAPGSPQLRQLAARAEDWDCRTSTLENWLGALTGSRRPQHSSSASPTPAALSLAHRR
jgi:glycosyltransferase involved in cell wall biosynthesis